MEEKKDFNLSFDYKGNKIQLTSPIAREVIKNVYDWLYQNNYNFNIKDSVNNDGNFYSELDIQDVIFHSTYKKWQFYKLSDDKYILLNQNIDNIKKDIKKKLIDFGIDENTIQFDNNDIKSQSDKIRIDIEERKRNLNLIENKNKTTENEKIEKKFLYSIAYNYNDILKYVPKSINFYLKNNEISIEISDCKIFTYFFLDNGVYQIKIGKGNYIDRYNAMLTGNPRLQILHICPYELHKEEELHMKFDDSRHDREWFHYTKGLQKFVSEQKEESKMWLEYYNKKMEFEKIESEIKNKINNN